MLTLSQIRGDARFVIERLKVKNFDAGQIVDRIVTVDKNRRQIQMDTNSLEEELNSVSRKIGILFKEGKTEEANRLKEQTGILKEKIRELNRKLADVEDSLEQQLVLLPNLPHESTPAGIGSEQNKLVREGGSVPDLMKDALPHWELAAKYNIIDFELGNKITGSGFPVYLGKGAQLQRALIGFFLDENIQAGYEEVLPPLMVNEDSGFGTGQLPDKEGQMYHVGSDNYFLIPTAEVPVTNIFRDLILNEEDLPIKRTAYTPCFRREAGSYGKDVRGLNRLHQFDKVEIVQIRHPGKSYKTLDEMVVHVEGILKKLDLPYRIMQLCGGDLSFASALTYDFEVYSAAQKKWLEVSSVSNFESFQANRLKLRYRDKNSKKPVLAHTLNGSALALPRIMAALLENNQTEKGIVIPGILTGYTGFEIIG
ncbi:MAG: serine--tRNA ligase [Bacteroidales bacterium]|jgi:seryl-tRNA synthetase